LEMKHSNEWTDTRFGVFTEVKIYEGVSKTFRTESITKYTLTTINTR